MSFGIVTTKFGGSVPPGGADQRRHEEIERAQAARVQLLRQRLDADADERRQRAAASAAATPPAADARVSVLFGVRPDAVAVLEVDPEVLDRLAAQLGDDARADRLGEAGRVVRQPTEAKRRPKRRRVRRILVERRERDARRASAPSPT